MNEDQTQQPIIDPSMPAVLDSELLIGITGPVGEQTYLIMDRTVRVKVTEAEMREILKGPYSLPTIAEFYMMAENLQQAMPDGIYYLHGTTIDDMLDLRRGCGDLAVMIDHGRIRTLFGPTAGERDAILVRRPRVQTRMAEHGPLRKVNAPRIAFLQPCACSQVLLLIVESVQVLDSTSGKTWEQAQDMESQINANFARSQPVIDQQRWKKLERNSTVIHPDHNHLKGSTLIRVTGQGDTVEKILDSIRENKVL